MPLPKPTKDHFGEDFLARERGQLFELWEGRRVHITDFYKHIMTISVAALGFNLTVDRPENLAINRPLDRWEWSIILFFSVILLALFVFLLTALHLGVQSLINDRYREHEPWVEKLDVVLVVFKAFVAFLAVVSFGFAMWMSISRFFI